MKKYCRTCHKRFDEDISICTRCEIPLADDVVTPEKITNCNFAYECPLDWGKLDETETEDTRFCRTCQKNVYFARSQSEIDELARRGNCVAFYPDDALKALRSSQVPPLMGFVVDPKRVADLEVRDENFSEQNEKKSWWKFWK